MKHRLFRKPRFALVYVMAAGLLWLGLRTTDASLRLGIVLAILGEALRLWANGYVGHVKVNSTAPWRGDPRIGELITGGPYAHVRNPLYFGSFLIGLGVCVIVGHWWVAVPALLLLIPVYRAKILEEEATLREEWPAEFARYELAVPRYVPTWRRYAERRGRWSWQGIRASHELKTVTWVLVILIALYFQAVLIQRRESFWRRHAARHLLLLGALIALVLSDGIVELVRRRRRARERRQTRGAVVSPTAGML